jgi:hypothetical protein
MTESAHAVAWAAFERGDQVLQLALPLTQQAGYITPMVGGGTSSTRSDIGTALNKVIRSGWELVSASVVFVQTGEVSRDKFFSSGQQTAISGEVVGYYLFSRNESNQDPSVRPVSPRSVTRREPSRITPLAPLD